MSQIIEFEIPLPIEECKRRLENRHQGDSLRASLIDGLLVKVKMKQVDRTTYKFTIRRINGTDEDAKARPGKFTGYIRALTPNSTALVGKAQLNWIAYFSNLLALALLIGFTVTSWYDPTIFATNLILKEIPYLPELAVVFYELNIIFKFVIGFSLLSSSFMLPVQYFEAKELNDLVLRIFAQKW